MSLKYFDEKNMRKTLSYEKAARKMCLYSINQTVRESFVLVLIKIDLIY
jgi:hypothetical protein